MTFSANLVFFELVVPILILVFPFVQNLEAEGPVAESLSQLLPSDSLADVFKNFGEVSFVVGVLAAFQLLAFAFNH